MIFLNGNDYVFNFHYFVLHFSRFFEMFVFQMFAIIFQAYEFSRPEIDIIKYGEAYIYVFDQFSNFRKCSIFVIFHHFRWSNLMVIRFFYSSRRLRVENVSFTTHLYVGKIRLSKTNGQTYFKSSFFGPKKRKRLRPQKLATSSDRLRIT